MSDRVNRRGFLASLLAAPVAAVAGPDPQRFVAPPAHEMPNRIEPGTEYEWREFGMSIEWDDGGVLRDNRWSMFWDGAK